MGSGQHNIRKLNLKIKFLTPIKSDKIGSLDYEDGRNDYYGYGKINAGRLLR